MLARLIRSSEGFRVSDALDEGPFFHGTIAQLRVGDFLTAGHRSNYRPEIVMNHVYFTALVDGAGLAAEIAAELAKGEGLPRVYEVAPTGEFENDPNVTDKKFPGNPTRSYRITAPLRIVPRDQRVDATNSRTVAGLAGTAVRAPLERGWRDHQLNARNG
jgi:hypothetical protein